MMLTWKLPELLDSKGVSAYRLHKAVERHRISPTTIYRWAREMPAALDANVLERVIEALRDLTGEEVNVQDLLEYAPTTETEPEEPELWLESDLSRLGEYDPYDWEEGEAEEGEPVKYEPGIGAVVSNG